MHVNQPDEVTGVDKTTDLEPSYPAVRGGRVFLARAVFPRCHPLAWVTSFGDGVNLVWVTHIERSDAVSPAKVDEQAGFLVA